MKLKEAMNILEKESSSIMSKTSKEWEKKLQS